MQCLICIFVFFREAKPKNITIEGAIATKGIKAYVKQTTENGISNCCVLSSNFPTYILDLVEDYSQSFNSVWNSMEIMIDNAKKYRVNARMKPDSGLDRKLEEIKSLRLIASEQTKKYAAELKKEQLERNEKYWLEHASERTELEAEKDLLETQIASMKAEYDEIIRRREERVEKLSLQRIVNH